MPKSPPDLTKKLRASIGQPLSGRAKRPYLGFANEYEEQIFRALVAVHPKGVNVSDAGWRLYADEHMKLGYFSCAINGARVYRLTHRGVRCAVEERLMKDPPA